MLKLLSGLATLAFCLMLSTTVSANSFPEGIISSFKQGNASALAKFMNEPVEITLDNQEQVYSKEQAELIMKDFFKKNEPQSTRILHQGGGSSALYGILEYISSGGTYRVTIYIKSVDSRNLVHQIRLEKNGME